MSTVEIKEGDCLDVMRRMVERGETVQAVVTDPPYDLVSVVKRFGKEGSAPARSEGPTGVYARASRGFMGKQWDGTGIAFNPETWRLCYDLLPPGGWLLAFGGTRTWHRMVVAIEDAGFEIRDTIGWLYGTGFPKSHDVSKAIDKAAGAELRVIGARRDAYGDAEDSETADGRNLWGKPSTKTVTLTKGGTTPEAARWVGWGTALKPSFEPIVLARKPLIGTVAENVLAHGTGALNIDATRISFANEADRAAAFPGGRLTSHGTGSLAGPGAAQNAARSEFQAERNATGRWPANLIHDGSDEVEEAFAAFGERPGQLARAKQDDTPKTNNIYGKFARNEARFPEPRNDSGSASRFFYSAKATAADRAGSRHPTVKPIGLKRWLARLVTPPGGTILDPFAGSGTTGAAALAEGFNAVLIEREQEYLADIYRRFGMVPSVPVALYALTAAHTRLSNVLARL